MTIEWQGGGSNKTFQGNGIDEFRVQQKGQENKDVNNFENRDEICPKRRPFLPWLASYGQLGSDTTLSQPVFIKRKKPSINYMYARIKSQTYSDL